MIQLAAIAAAEPGPACRGRHVIAWSSPVRAATRRCGPSAVPASKTIETGRRPRCTALQARARSRVDLRHPRRDLARPGRHYLPAHATHCATAAARRSTTSSWSASIAVTAQRVAGTPLAIGAGPHVACRRSPCTCSTTRTVSRSCSSRSPGGDRRADTEPAPTRRLRDRRQARAEGDLHRRARMAETLQGRRRGAHGRRAPSEEDIDDYIAGFTSLVSQPLVLH